MGNTGDWICCQIGAREHYAVARALHRRGRLTTLITDAWCPPRGIGKIIAAAHSRFGQRYHPGLAAARISATTFASLVEPAAARFHGRDGWARIVARNAAFQKRAANLMMAMPGPRGAGRTVFAYSYAAGDILASARARGWNTVLGQIDPGPVEAALVARLEIEAGRVPTGPPESYWTAWRREVELADVVAVNSEWSRDGLVEAGVPRGKIRVLPLAFEPDGPPPAREPLPAAFTAARPLRLLFLGQVTLRKGVGPLFDALELLADAPVETTIVGPLQVAVPPALAKSIKVRVLGPVPRGTVGAYYAAADAMLFPTLSDGFGMTQIEALAAGVPIIASRNCAAVVEDGVTGLLLGEVTAKVIEEAVRRLLVDPSQLEAMSLAAPSAAAGYGIEELANGLAAFEPSLGAA